VKTYSVVIVNYNCARLLEACIKSAVEQTVKPLEIVIVDSASTDASALLLKAHFSGLSLVLLPENKGFTAAANAGLARCAGEYILLLNADVILDRFYVEQVMKDANIEEQYAGIFSGKLLKLSDETLIDSTGQFLSKALKPKERGYCLRDENRYLAGPVFTACGAVGMYSGRMLEDLKEEGKVFDESLFMYYEDLDLGMRANLLGWKAYYVPGAIAKHARGGSVNKEERTLSRRYAFPGKPLILRRALVRNRYLVLLKDFPLQLLLVYLPVLLCYEVVFLCYLFIFDISAAYGIIEAFKGAGAALAKRRVIMKRKRISGREILKWVL